MSDNMDPSSLDALTPRLKAIDLLREFASGGLPPMEEFIAACATAADILERLQVVDVLFDGPPGPECGRFVEVNDLTGASMNVGDWIDYGQGLHSLRVLALPPKKGS